MKTIGMYGGKFLPVHNGHVGAMVTASTIVDELHVIVSYDEEHEKELFKDSPLKPIPYKQRVRWWCEITKDMDHVKVHAVYEEQTGAFEDWERGAVGIKEAIGQPITHVFSSETHYGEFFEKLYPDAEHIVIDEERVAHTISGTAIREEGAIKHWDKLPRLVRPYFVKKVVVVGTESAGKSTLVKNLAHMFNTSFVEEYGRTFYESRGLTGNSHTTMPEDYDRIAIEQKYHEENQTRFSDKVMFIDTEAIVTQYYSKLYDDNYSHIAQAIYESHLQEYDLWLFLQPDVPWVDDGMRLHGDEMARINNNEIFRFMLEHYGGAGKPIKHIEGNYYERLQQAISEVKNVLEEE